MILPGTELGTLLLLLLGMLCWGCWTGTFKMTREWRFELFYFDFAVGVLLTTLIAVATFGNLGFDGFTFLDDFRHAGLRQDAWALSAGCLLNVGTMLLLGSVSISGMAVAFPITLGTALVITVIWNYVQTSAGDKALVFGGAVAIVISIIFAAIAYRHYAFIRSRQAAREGRARQVRRSMSTKGIILSAVAGIAIALASPVLKNAMVPDIGLGPYAVSLTIGAGMFFSTFVLNLIFMNLPIDGTPLEMSDYLRGTGGRHLLGLAGGFVWAVGLLAFMVAASGDPKAKVDPVLDTALRNAPAVVAMLCGGFLFREFQGADGKTSGLAGATLLLFAGGVAMTALAVR